MDNVQELSSIYHASSSSDEERVGETNLESWRRKRRFFPSTVDDYVEDEEEYQNTAIHPTSTPLCNSYETARQEILSDTYITGLNTEKSPSLAPEPFIEDENSADTVLLDFFAEEEILTDQDSSSLTQADISNRNPSPSFSATDELISKSDLNSSPIKRKAYTVKHWNSIPEDVLLNLNIPITKRRRLGNPVMDDVIQKYLESQESSNP